MSSNQLFPDEIIDNSAESNFHKHSLSTKLIYITTVLFVVFSLALLPFINVDVSVRSQGVIRPITERNQLTSLVSGEIQNLYVQENEFVKKRDKIAEISAPIIKEKIQFNKQRQQEIREYLNDLSHLKDLDSTSVFKSVDLRTAKYEQSFLKFKQEAGNAFQKMQEAKQKLQRDRQLYNQDFLSKAMYEKTSYSLRSARNSLQLLFERQLNKWQTDQISYQNELEQLQNKEEQFKKELQQHVIRAPISGTIQNLKGIYKGSFVSPNQKLAEISPDTGLIAECYVPPKDIGLLKEGMEARFQVSAYNFKQWGMLTGTIVEISNDVSVINDRPVFIVESRLNKTYLELENGYRGTLKKGMTMQARFTITQRSLFELLYDNVDDWLNPNWDKQNQKNQQASL